MIRRDRPPSIVGSVALVSLADGRIATIDAADAEVVERFLWCGQDKKRTVYAISRERVDGKYRTLRLHRLIMNAPDDAVVDHIDGDGLNNRRSNLRLVSGAQNARNRRVSLNNSSGAKGVHFLKAAGKWTASIRIDTKKIHLGTFRCRTAAALAYVKGSKELHREFGRAS